MFGSLVDAASFANIYLIHLYNTHIPTTTSVCHYSKSDNKQPTISIPKRKMLIYANVLSYGIILRTLVHVEEAVIAVVSLV